MTATPIRARSMGTHLTRLDGHEKVTGRATYAAEHGFTLPERPLHAWLVTSTIPRGRVERVDASDALAHRGVVTVVDHTSARRLAKPDDAELAVLQDDAIAFRGQIVAVVLAETIEAAREGARLVRVHQTPADSAPQVVIEDGEPYTPEAANAGHEPDVVQGDVDAALARAAVTVDATYTTPHEFNNPMEPHAVTATWDGDTLTLWDSTQSVHGVAAVLGRALGLARGKTRVLAPYVGGGFGSKGLPHAPEMAAALAAFAADGRPVQLAVTRQQMFALTGYRTQTESRVRLGAEPDGRLVAITHDALSQTSRYKEFVEQTATAARMMYAADARSTTHRVVPLDVAVPAWMRAPGEMPGMYAHEVAMDELAVACGVDPVDLRVRNEPEVEPETGNPFNERRLVECLQRGADRFGWADRDPEPGSRLVGDWRVGLGMASATYPALFMPGNTARIRALGDQRYAVDIGAVDIGTGARTVLTQIAADALGVEPGRIELSLGDTALPKATVAGGSAGTSSWGTAIVLAAQQLRADHGDDPDAGVESSSTSEGYPDMENLALHSFGAVFVEARVHRWTGEVRVPRMLGVYSVGRVINPTTARSQLLGGLVMGLSGALFEDGYRDPRHGHVVTQDLATYHVASHADVGDLQVEWLDEEDTAATPMGSRGIGEIGIVGTAAAVANATFHATGTRVRALPVTADHFLG
ncbi:xanthine dehydrogenase family protein molybdopterin-binding subunit [Nocardioides sp. CFH 31398]|uniref:xanthine dehydrogenase family protein molybdopterin-binding subunit n=1 Tax=Nocardioides sp. CFH 31398 TaxID=2919579 RepID=UPI001F067C38|nr:xanthine dehydrogenase family protein molybdopterin-binding subunit [Nocardioides sp. CFH 31398]MCH1866231.1 xanthine dehydrogenase family protein molybdopterin-binding subunit [Nocardioides sp. CFH 31398]